MPGGLKTRLLDWHKSLSHVTGSIIIAYVSSSKIGGINREEFHDWIKRLETVAEEMKEYEK